MPRINQKIEALKVEMILPEVFRGHTYDKKKIKQPKDKKLFVTVGLNNFKKKTVLKILKIKNKNKNNPTIPLSTNSSIK